MRVETFGPLIKNDIVTVSGLRGSWKFLSADVVEGRFTVLNLVGGRPKGPRNLRSFPADRVQIPTERQLAKQRATRVSP